jgi:hypothetical protein
MVSSWLLFGGEYRMWFYVLLRVARNAAIIGGEADWSTGTRSRFVSCIQLLSSIAAAAAIASAELNVAIT